MKLGLFSINMGERCRPDVLADTAVAAEAAGFDSLWAGEHVILPDPRVPPSPMDPQDPALDPLVALTWAAACTTSIRLATGIVIVPQRNPVVLAKQIANLDVLSGGRFVFGAGVGYLEPEFRAIGANFEERGAVTDDFLEAMTHLWYDEHPEHHGRFSDFANVDAYPRPMQRAIPIVIGGHTPAAYRRAVARGTGWYGFGLSVEQTQACLDGLREAAERVDRPTELGELEITVTPRGRLSAERAAEYAALGVHRLVPMLPPSGDELVATLDGALDAVAGLDG